MNGNTNGGTSPFQLALVWIFVSIPLLWGVYRTLLNALDLFK